MGVQETEQLWGGETTKAVANFPVSGETVPVPVVRWLGRIKAAAARVNSELGLLDADLAARISAAAERVAEGEFDDQFPIDVFQTGSGTSTNMNANEVIANLAGAPPGRTEAVRIPTITSTWVSPRTTCSPRRCTWPRWTRRPTTCCPRWRAGGVLRCQGERVPGHRQVRPHASDGRRPGHARPGVLRLRGPGPAGHPADPERAAPGRADPARWHRHRHRAEHPPGVRRTRPRRT